MDAPGKKLLFICSRNRWRSPTAEALFDGVDGLNARSAGTEPSARIRVTAGHIGWADLVFVMEKKHFRRLQERFADEISGKQVICLNIPDPIHGSRTARVAGIQCDAPSEQMKTNHAFDDCLSRCRQLGFSSGPVVLVVSVSCQTAALFEQGRIAGEFPCSTSRFGIGQQEGSNCTPLGLHRIAEKIGAGEPPGTVFKARQIVGHTSQPELADAKITTRILWLEGLEPGFNQGGNVDSHARYIYIHGTADQSSIGKPSSCGCIHLADRDLIPLFDKLSPGTLVWISED
jgi:predicted protein tyrosine phosphatase